MPIGISKNVPQSYFDCIYNGNLEDEQEEYDLHIWLENHNESLYEEEN